MSAAPTGGYCYCMEGFALLAVSDVPTEAGVPASAETPVTSTLEDASPRRDDQSVQARALTEALLLLVALCVVSVLVLILLIVARRLRRPAVRGGRGKRAKPAMSAWTEAGARARVEPGADEDFGDLANEINPDDDDPDADTWDDASGPRRG